MTNILVISIIQNTKPINQYRDMDKQLTPEEFAEEFKSSRAFEENMSCAEWMRDLTDAIRKRDAQTKARVRRESLEWVSVEDKLPEYGEKVLVSKPETKSKNYKNTFEQHFVIATLCPHPDGLDWHYDWAAVRQFSEVTIRDNHGAFIGKVRPDFFMQWAPTHWMPLPSPPEE